MKSLLRKWRERRQQKRRQRENLQTLHLWAQLEKIFESGLLTFDYKHHRLFVTQSMAALMMQNGAEGWVRSVHNIYEYAHWLQTQRAWEDFMHKEELAAVRKAMADNPKLRRPDIERIKRARRQEIAVSDMEPPKVEPFEFFIVPDSTEAKVEPIAVGYYDPTTGQMETATWDEVQPLIRRSEP